MFSIIPLLFSKSIKGLLFIVSSSPNRRDHRIFKVPSWKGSNNQKLNVKCVLLHCIAYTHWNTPCKAQVHSHSPIV